LFFFCIALARLYTPACWFFAPRDDGSGECCNFDCAASGERMIGASCGGCVSCIRPCCERGEWLAFVGGSTRGDESSLSFGRSDWLGCGGGSGLSDGSSVGVRDCSVD
jgi:hypothetical protein